jgi:hypothetical protein
MSFNVRTSGGDPHDGDNCWDNRKKVVGQIMQKYKPAVAGLQVRACGREGSSRDVLA